MINFKTLYAIRHSQTHEDRGNICSGWTEATPIESDIDKVHDIIINFVSNKQIGLIICSEQSRTIKTAQSIQTKLGISKLTIDSCFNDLDFGYFSGKSPGLIKKIQPEIYDDRGFFKYYMPLKDGESLANLETRVRKGLKRLSTLCYSKDILLITHGSVIVMLHKILFNQDYYNFFPTVDIEARKYKIFEFQTSK